MLEAPSVVSDDRNWFILVIRQFSVNHGDSFTNDHKTHTVFSHSHQPL
jgi:hypothetical protein